MRRFLLLLLVLTGGLAMYSPGFRLLWAMEASSARIGLVHSDGVTQWSQSGPKSYWPAWAPAPAGATLKVAVHYEPAPGYGESGMAYLTLRAPAAEAQAAYARQLEAAGWAVSASHYTGQLPEIPPQPVRFCFIQATRDGKRLVFRALEGEREQDSLIWDYAPAIKPISGAQPGFC
jgi:hypothetical protein